MLINTPFIQKLDDRLKEVVEIYLTKTQYESRALANPEIGMKSISSH